MYAEIVMWILNSISYEADKWLANFTAYNFFIK